MQTRKLLLLALLAASALFVAGCTSQTATPPVPTASPTPAPTPAPGSDAVKVVDGVQVVTITGTDFKFTPSSLTLAPGRTKFVFANHGAVPHELVIYAADRAAAFVAAHKKEMAGGPEAERSVPGALVAEAEDVDAGATKETNVVDLAAGTYEMGCLIPGHYEAGMKGTLTVEGAPVPATPTASTGVRTENGVQVATVEMTDFKFAPADIHVAPGPVKIAALNMGAVTHELLLYPKSEAANITAAAKIEESGGPSLEDQAAGKAILTSIEDVGPGQSKESAVVTLAPGTYEFACHIPGHYEAGMKATITVA